MSATLFPEHENLPDGFGYFISLNVLPCEFESLFHELNLFEFWTFINKFDDNGYAIQFSAKSHFINPFSFHYL